MSFASPQRERDGTRHARADRSGAHPDLRPRRVRGGRAPARLALGALTGSVCLLLWGEAAAAQPNRIGDFKRWSAYVVADGDAKHCFAFSKPTREQGRYTRRGDVSVTISHRTKDKVRNEISFSAGYSFRPESEVEVLIDGKQRFSLFVDGESAWAPDAKTDAELRKAIERGSNMVVKGRSSRGTLTTDTYSLAGSSAALEAIDRACGG